MKQQCEFAKQAQNPDQGPKLDLSFKEGQTIKLNIAVSAAPARRPWPPHQAQPRAATLLTVQHVFIEQQPNARYCAGGEQEGFAITELKSGAEMRESRCDYVAGRFCDLRMSSVP